MFTMARSTSIKNLTGLVDWYGRCPRLRELATCWSSAATSTPSESGDNEEREQIERMHR
jgi:sucrose synthase